MRYRVIIVEKNAPWYSAAGPHLEMYVHMDDFPQDLRPVEWLVDRNDKSEWGGLAGHLRDPRVKALDQAARSLPAGRHEIEVA